MVILYVSPTPQRWFVIADSPWKPRLHFLAPWVSGWGNGGGRASAAWEGRGMRRGWGAVVLGFPTTLTPDLLINRSLAFRHSSLGPQCSFHGKILLSRLT